MRADDELTTIETALCYFLERIPLDSVADERRVESAIEAVAKLRAQAIAAMPPMVTGRVQ